MKAIIVEKFGDLDQVTLGDIPTPEPAANEIQIQVNYAAINPVDWKICAGLLRDRMPYEFPITLGWDVAGSISKMGKDVSQFKIGDEVFAYARKAKIKEGTLAEYVCLDANSVALKPSKLNLKEAASIPLTGLTAWQALFEAAKLTSHETILIQAGAGGVGSMAIQFAKQHQATVITTASANKLTYVKQLGADIAIDYHQENFVTRIKELFPQGIDVVFDTVGGTTLQASLDSIKNGGRLVSITQQVPDDIATQHHITASYVFVHPSGKQLKLIADLIDAGNVVPPQIKEYPFAKTREALQELKIGHTQGKIVIKIR